MFSTDCYLLKTEAGAREPKWRAVLRQIRKVVLAGHEKSDDSVDGGVDGEADDDLHEAGFGLLDLARVVASGEILNADDNNTDDAKDADSDSHNVYDEVEKVDNFAVPTAAIAKDSSLDLTLRALCPCRGSGQKASPDRDESCRNLAFH